MTLAQHAKRLLGSRFLRSVLTLVSANAVGQAILLAVTPLVARLYGPSEFGIFAAFNALMATVLVASSFRYEFAVPLPRTDQDGRVLLLLALLLNLLTAAAATVCVALWGSDLAKLLHVPELASVLWTLPIVLVGAGSYKAFRFWAVRRHDFNGIARTRIVQSVANAAMQVVGGLIGLGVLGLVIGQFFGFSAGTLRLAQGGALRWATGRRSTLWPRMRILASRYGRFPKFDVPAAVVDTISVQLPNLLLAVLFSPATAGYYLLADRIVGAPLGLISQAIGQVLYARSRDAIARGSLAQFAAVIAASLLAAITLPAAAVFFLGQSAFTLVFGDQWREAGIYSSWLILGLSIQFIYSSISVVLSATNAQNVNLYIHTIILLMKAAVIWYGYSVGSSFAAIVGFSLANTVGYLSAIAIVIIHARTYVPSTSRRN